MTTSSFLRMGVLGLVGFLMIAPTVASAATLEAVVSTSKVHAGNIFTARVLINSIDQPINNAEGVLSFPTELLKVISVDTVGSVFPLWIQKPTFSNINGSVIFNGGVPSPGFTGTGGMIVTITFQAKKPGTATLSLGSEAIRANDGLGTNVFQGASNAVVVIQDALPPPPKPVEPTPPKPVPITPRATTTASTSPPITITPVTQAPAACSLVEEQRVRIGSLSMTYGSAALGLSALMLLLLLAILLLLLRLHAARLALGSGVSRTEKDLHKGFTLLRDELDQHLQRLERAQSGRVRTAAEKKAISVIETDIADLERFARRRLEELRDTLGTGKADKES